MCKVLFKINISDILYTYVLGDTFKLKVKPSTKRFYILC